MPIPVSCACGTTTQAKDELFGQKIRCTNCGSMLAALPPVRDWSSPASDAAPATPLVPKPAASKSPPPAPGVAAVQAVVPPPPAVQAKPPVQEKPPVQAKPAAQFPPLPARVPAYTPTSYPSPNAAAAPAVPPPTIPVAAYAGPSGAIAAQPAPAANEYGVGAEPVVARPAPFTPAPETSYTERARRSARDDSGGEGFGTTNAGVVGGIFMMIVAVIWFGAGIAMLDRIYFYPPILFVLGVVAVIKGLAE